MNAIVQNDVSAAARYDAARRGAHDNRLPPGYPTPQPTSAWPVENIALLERYREWLLSSGTNPDLVNVVYVPMAGNVLGLNLKPHTQLTLDTDFECAFAYVSAKQPGRDWLKMSRNALDKFRCFLRQERGSVIATFKVFNVTPYLTGLPDWLAVVLQRYQRLCQAQWRPERQHERLAGWWNTHTRLWRWVQTHYPFTHLTDIKRQHILAYLDQRLAEGRTTTTINQELRAFRALLVYLQDQEPNQPVPSALLRLRDLREPERLPRYLTDAQICALRAAQDQRVQQAHTPTQQRNTLLDRAVFYLLWQGGLRRGEAEMLLLEDLDLPGTRLIVRQGKGRQDRTVYLSPATVQTLQAYLEVRGLGPSTHVFLYHNQPVGPDLFLARIKTAGQRVGVRVTPHQLRHTYATQLLNAGCQVTTIQRLLGHRRLNSTMLYAWAHDATVAADYQAAMASIENRLVLANTLASVAPTLLPETLQELLAGLADPKLDPTRRLELVAALRNSLEITLPLPLTR